MKKKIRKIYFITNGYPSKLEPFLYTFLAQLVYAIAELDVKCTVIHPVSLTHYFGNSLPSRYSKEFTSKGNVIEVYRPRYISFSSKRIGFINTASWTLRKFTAAANRTLSDLSSKPDALYGHFIFPSGLAVANISKKLNVPAFCAVGEGEPWTIEMLGSKRTQKILSGQINLFTVSSSVKRMLLGKLWSCESEMPIFPNGVNLDNFHKMERGKMREKYGFPPHSFIVAFVGKFTAGKGIFNLIKAIDNLQGVHAIYIGSGNIVTNPETTLFKGRLPHDEVPQMLNAADVFVLPTLVEGSCNAIIEALACGLPVVSSNYDFNDEILNDQCAIQVDPLSVSEIRQAILKLKNDPLLREKMSKAALKKARELDIKKRARDILSWMDTRISSTAEDK